jgi:hypothetical protein
MIDVKKEQKKQGKPATGKENPASDVQHSTSGAKRLDPTRYGDWEINGKCVDF